MFEICRCSIRAKPSEFSPDSVCAAYGPLIFGCVQAFLWLGTHAHELTEESGRGSL